MNIGRRIQVGFGVVIGVSLLLGASALVELEQIETRADRMGDDHMPGLVMAGRIEVGQAKSIALFEQQLSAQNERDGYLSDPEYLAAVAAWRADDTAIAAD